MPELRVATSETAAAIKRARDHRAAETVPGRGNEARVQIPPKQHPDSLLFRGSPELRWPVLSCRNKVSRSAVPLGAFYRYSVLLRVTILSYFLPRPILLDQDHPRLEPLVNRRSPSRESSLRIAITFRRGDSPLLAAVRAVLCPPFEITGRTPWDNRSPGFR